MRSIEVVVEDVAFAFGDRTVLSEFSACFHANKVGALVGPSGSGKSTLLAAIGGGSEPTSGRIRLRSSIDSSESSPRAEDVAWVPQGANCLGARSALDNVLLAPLSEGVTFRDARRRARDALHLVGLLDRAESLARTLSGGELQRVSLARAIASSKPIILADEPTSSLDAENTAAMADLLHTLTAGATIIVATHDPLLIDAADYFVEIRGRDHAA